MMSPRYFDTVATGFHLKEYTASESIKLFKTVGFSKVRAYVTAKGHYVKFPLPLIKLCEGLLDVLPDALGKSLARSLPLRLLLDVRLVGTK